MTANFDPQVRDPRENLVEGSISRHIFRLSGAMIVGFLAMTLGHLIEIFYLGMVGLDALAAITFSFPITMSLTAIIRGIGIGAASIVARAIGEANRNVAAITTTHCHVLIIMITLALSIVGYFYADRIYYLMGARGEVLGLVHDYTQVWLIGFPLVGFALASNGIIRSFGNARYSGLIMVSAPLVQVIVGPFLIFGWLGAPALGLLGAAWASVLGYLCQFLISGFWYFYRERLFQPEFRAFGHSCTSILHVGIPAAATNLIQPFSSGVSTWLLAGYGVTVVAGFGVATRIESVVAMVTIGIATSVVPIVGQNWGAGRFQRVREVLRTCNLACQGWGLIAALLMWLGAPVFVKLISDDALILETAVTFLYIVPISIGFMGMITVATHSFNALRNPGPALILSLARLLVVYIPLALILGDWFGYPGVFIATSVSNIVVGVWAVVWNNRVIVRASRSPSPPSRSSL